MNFNFTGVSTALVTPFKGDQIDFASLEKLVHFQLEGNINGLVVNGTTGESPSLSLKEVEDVYKFVREEVKGRIPVILGTGSNSTARTVELTQTASNWGPDGFLVVVPYYNKPPQRGLIEHFKAVAKATELPVILYNVPGRTITSLESRTIAELSQVTNIVGIKEASANMDLVEELSQTCKEGFLLLSGDDTSCFEFVNQGGQGVVSVISNVIPSGMVELIKQARTENINIKSKFDSQFGSLNAALNCESNPIPVKMALQLMGVIQSSEMRLPLVRLASQLIEPLKLALRASNIETREG